jgi:hypothetical protein
MKPGVLGLFCLLWSAVGLSPVWAHGGVGIEKDPCVRRAGPYLIHFAVYRPQFDPAAEYCAAVPNAGNTILVFDLVDPELRRRPLTIQVPEALSAPAPKTVLYLPPQTYPTGVVNAEAHLDLPGQYTAIMTFAEPADTIQFPLRVAMWPPGVVALGSVLVLGSALGYVSMGRKKGWPMPFGPKRTPKLRLLMFFDTEGSRRIITVGGGPVIPQYGGAGDVLK